ncbi:hypothetical protein PI124_g13451 [Phytophthora idaei]|nr:hypothetical protein PI125_g5042 [Phytophthora idaei]KAG3164648.1 hypothetical protein PI126_g5005 [Phytophthora idaei]KAG3241688.1 hypothetical protein PI124_g13451 [Phytophthora idaei]
MGHLQQAAELVSLATGYEANTARQNGKSGGHSGGRGRFTNDGRGDHIGGLGGDFVARVGNKETRTCHMWGDEGH